MKHDGILLINKEKGISSFYLVKVLRKISNIKKIGYAGTLDPIATGVMIMLVGKNYTKLSDKLSKENKQYMAKIKLGISTNTYDTEGNETYSSDKVPSIKEIEETVEKFQGNVEQIPPMFSSKKIDGKRLYKLARKGIEVERKSISVTLETKILKYEYPHLYLDVKCSSGTYIRTIANDIGNILGSGGHIEELERTKVGTYTLEACADINILNKENISSYFL